MRHLRIILLASTTTLPFSLTAHADPQVMASIKPVHSLVAGVMGGVGTPELLVDGGASPHTYSLRPSKARGLERADIIFWVGPQMEAFLKKPISNIGQEAVIVRLDETPELVKLPIREGATFEAHDDDHDDHHHDDHDQEDHHEDDHDEDEHHANEHDEEKADGDQEHVEITFDAHLWLDPKNAEKFTRRIADVLSKSDPENASHYAANAAALLERLEDLETEIRETLEPVRGNPFIVFHDAYQNFEHRFGVPATGSITLSPEIPPGAERIREIRNRVKELDVECVFSEPQFRPGLISTVTEGTNARAGVLDPLGTDIDDGPDLYFDMMRGLANAMHSCLADSNE